MACAALSQGVRQLIKHVLVTNDFPPKVGGIQSYLFEIYSRLDPESYLVATTVHEDAAAFDRKFPGEVIRLKHRLLPVAGTRSDLLAVVSAFQADLVVYDPIWPIGALGARLGPPYGLIAHGAEVVLPAKLPGVAGSMRRSLSGARGVIAAGSYPMQAVRSLVPTVPTFEVAPGADLSRFVPTQSVEERDAIRKRFMGDSRLPMILFVSRLVPRKGADRVIEAARLLDQPVEVHIVGSGRDRARLERLAKRRGVNTIFHGALPDGDLEQVYRAADVFCFPARSRWLGLEQEGFGIVLVEAQASGARVVCTRTGGMADAVVGTSPVVLDEGSAAAVAGGISFQLKADPKLPAGERHLIIEKFDYGRLSLQYGEAILKLAKQ